MSRKAELGRVVCLGEALVDLVCERPIASLPEADSFVARPGGSLANIAVCAARFGANVEMLGGVGDDEWGHWLRNCLMAEGVDVKRLKVISSAWTSHAFVGVSHEGEPSFAFYGDGEPRLTRLDHGFDEILDGPAGVLVVGSDTLVTEPDRGITLKAALKAGESGWSVLCDPNLRPNRWPDEPTMLAVVRALVQASTLVKLNVNEALRLSGEADAEAAGEGLLRLGPEAAAITLGADGALLTVRGSEPARVSGFEAQLVDSTGAGDSVTGTLAAAMAAGTALGALAPALTAAMSAAAGVVSAWGAWEGLPTAARARSLLASPPN
ncbi:MAG: PfkB family carbohydrate kinase [Actinomycetota bacterium]|nr:PfkB family carbohydrate kinase [Actinomycetota bacterium]